MPHLICEIFVLVDPTQYCNSTITKAHVHPTLSFCYWACKNIMAAYSQWSSDEIYIMYVWYKVELETECPVLQQSKAVCALMLYSPVVTAYTASLTFNNSIFCPHSAIMCFVWILEQIAIIFAYSIKWLVFIIEILQHKSQWSLYVPPV